LPPHKILFRGPLAPEPPPEVVCQRHLLNDILAELWRVGTIPGELTLDQTSEVVSLAALKRLCTGVPDDAELGQLKIVGQPGVRTSSISQLNLRLDIEFLVPVESTTPAFFLGVLGLEVPLEFQAISAVVRPSHGAIERLTRHLTVGAFSQIRPRSEQARQELEAALVEVARSAFLDLSHNTSTLSFTGSADNIRARRARARSKLGNRADQIRRSHAARHQQRAQRVGGSDRIRPEGGLCPWGAPSRSPFVLGPPISSAYIVEVAWHSPRCIRHTAMPQDRRTLETWRGFARSARLLAHRTLDAAPSSLQYTHSIPYPERLERMMVDRQVALEITPPQF
jgi:hypothetical protein